MANDNTRVPNEPRRYYYEEQAIFAEQAVFANYEAVGVSNNYNAQCSNCHSSIQDRDIVIASRTPLSKEVRITFCRKC